MPTRSHTSSTVKPSGPWARAMSSAASRNAFRVAVFLRSRSPAPDTLSPSSRQRLKKYSDCRIALPSPGATERSRSDAGAGVDARGGGAGGARNGADATDVPLVPGLLRGRVHDLLPDPLPLAEPA